MPIKLRQQKTQPNQTITFAFGTDRVLSFVVGVANWDFRLNNNHVRKLALSLASNQPDANTVTVRVNGTLHDDSGNSINNGSSTVTVCCVALVNSSDPNLTLAGANAIPNGGASAPIALPGSSLAIRSAFVAGFDLTHGSDNHVRGLLIAAGFTSSGTQGQITAQVTMDDSSGNNATGALDGGVIAATPAETGLYVRSLINQQTTSPVSVDFGTAISDAVVLLQTVDAEFPGVDHHISSIGGGTTGWTVASPRVTLANARAFMTDGSNNKQDDSKSNVSLVVVAIP